MKREHNCFAAKRKKAEKKSIIQKGKKQLDILFTCKNDNYVAVIRKRLIIILCHSILVVHRKYVA